MSGEVNVSSDNANDCQLVGVYGLLVGSEAVQGAAGGRALRRCLAHRAHEDSLGLTHARRSMRSSASRSCFAAAALVPDGGRMRMT